MKSRTFHNITNPLVHDPVTMRMFGVRQLNDFQYDDVIAILNNFTKVMVVRHPLVRVLSAWMESADEGVLRSGLIKEAQLDFEGAQLLGDARRIEALSDTTFDNALAWLASRDILESESIQTGKRGGRDTRYARGEKWAELEGLGTLLATALRDG